MPVSKVDLDKCIGCGACVESCPMDVFRLDTVVEYREEASPCSAACPLGPRQREYHDLLKMGMVDAAAAIMAECHPMPAITGRLCPHPCETDCSRGAVDAAVNINALEQYLGDHLLTVGAGAAPAPGAADTEGRVAVIGSGPAGLSAAYFLAREGFLVTVFEKDEDVGGLLRTAVPVFRLPDAVLDAQVAEYRALGVEFRTGVQVGRDVGIEGLRAQGYGAVIAATGAARPLGLSVPGGDAEGVVSAMDFLRAAKKGAARKGAALCEGATVAVIGGGSVALDAARTAVRLGAKAVAVVCLEVLEPGLKDSMVALPEEVAQAQAEGVDIIPSRAVDSFEVDGVRVSAIQCVECLSVRDEDGLFAPVYGTCALPQPVAADLVIVATGQVADRDLVPAGFPIDLRGRIAVDRETGEAGSGLFAAGDAVTGASTIVQALAAGKKAAEAAARYLRGEDESERAGERPVASPPPRDKLEILARCERAIRPAAERRRDVLETTAGFSPAQAQREAERCLTCGSRSRIAYLDDCQVCKLCQKYCPTDAIDVTEGQLLGSLHGWNVVELGR
jgi:NADPH-dependent glutamate synthase beta subunit-like oxidoreductase